jgi:hypothetical protein
MVDQRETLAVTTDLLTRFIWFALPGLELSTLGSVSSNPAFYHYAIWYLDKRYGCTFAYYPFPEAILVKATTSTQSIGRGVYMNTNHRELSQSQERFALDL